MDQNTINFRKTVYRIVSGIPSGKVATYGQVARLAGKPKAVRAVGYAMKINPNAPRVPCHRVVGAGGELTGYSGPNGLTGKKLLLEKEGVLFCGNRVDLARSGIEAEKLRLLNL